MLKNGYLVMCFRRLKKMKTRNFIRLLMVVSLVLGCASANTGKVTDGGKVLDELVTKNSFEIVAEWAQPRVTSAMASIANAGLLALGNSINNINLIGNSNYLKVFKDSVSGYLPYFGERQMGGSYGGGTTAIQFEGAPKEYRVKKGKKHSYTIQFNIADKNSPTENYTISIQLFKNLAASIDVTSSHRFFIRYRGKVSAIEGE